MDGESRPLRPRPGWLPAVDPQRCTGCGRCVSACDELHLLALEVVRWKKTASLHDAAQCTGCSACAVTCPFRAITMRRSAITPGAQPSGPEP